MQDMLLSQYKGIRDTISANVQTIRRLLDQARGLQEIAEKMQEGDLRNSVEKQVKGLQALIEQLIVQTQELFDKYEDFVRKAFPQ